MQLIDQHTKEIMEGCKVRALEAGLQFDKETLEYIVTNRDLLELSPKAMIPTLYDYWVHDVELLKDKGIYEVYPNNPYETVINTRPAISFYNDNNPDWLNVMIFYHVLAHIDFFQNNRHFENTWADDFCGQALADKRLIAQKREEKGEDSRWVDYIIEFTRGIDNLVGYHSLLNKNESVDGLSERASFYFGEFLRNVKKITQKEYLEEIDKYNEIMRQFGEANGENIFFEDVKKRRVEFAKLWEKYQEKAKRKRNVTDLVQYIIEYSDFLARSDNEWMKEVMQVVRNTSLYFSPQIRTKIANEGWASYWHQKLFLQDERISGNEVMFAKVNSGVMQMPRVGLNPYALGCALLEFMEDMAEKGKFSYAYQRIYDVKERRDYDHKAGKGKEFLFDVRKNFNDFQLIAELTDEDFQDFVDKHRLFVAGKKLNPTKRKWEYYVKSRKGRDYRNMVFDTLYHPPYITVDENKGTEGILYLNHHFEGRMLITEFIPNTMMGIEYLWGNPVQLETTEFEMSQEAMIDPDNFDESKLKKKRVLYTMQKKNLSRKEI